MLSVQVFIFVRLLRAYGIQVISKLKLKKQYECNFSFPKNPPNTQEVS